MKIFIIIAIILTVVAVSQAQTDTAYTGQPGCLTEEEVTVGVYPHFRIKRGYWKCTVLGQAATLELCPIAQGFLQPAGACVPWAEWFWTPTVAPPSAPVTASSEGSGQ